LICPDIAIDPIPENCWVAYTNRLKNNGQGMYGIKLGIRPGTYDAPAGQYPAVIWGTLEYNDISGPPFNVYSTQFFYPPFFDIITLDVVAGG
jgi:hypothetical protein